MVKMPFNFVKCLARTLGNPSDNSRKGHTIDLLGRPRSPISLLTSTTTILLHSFVQLVLAMVLNLWKLPIKNFLSILIKVSLIHYLKSLFKLRSKGLVRLRQCNKKVDEFVEEHRFTISKKRKCDDLKIEICMETVIFRYHRF